MYETNVIKIITRVKRYLQNDVFVNQKIIVEKWTNITEKLAIYVIEN